MVVPTDVNMFLIKTSTLVTKVYLPLTRWTAGLAMNAVLREMMHVCLGLKVKDKFLPVEHNSTMRFHI